MKQSNFRIGAAYFTTIISISLVLFLLGVFSFMILNVNKLQKNIKENIQFTVELKDSFKEIELKQFQKKLDAKSYIRQTRFISKEQAAKEFTEEIGEDFVSFLEYNPLPSIIEINLKSDYTVADSIAWIEQELSNYNQVSDITYQRSLIEIINKNVKQISIYILIFCLLLGIISVVLINNTIRLMVYSKRFLLRTMSLIGATNSFIRRPFVTSSVFYGLNAGLVANILLFQLIFYLQNEVRGIVQLQEMNLLIPLFAGVLIAGVLISVICTKFALDKYLNLSKEKLYY